MRFLADESCDNVVIQAYLDIGHDVLAMSRISPGASDTDVLTASVGQDRILLTEDKDFGELVYLAGLQSCGIVLFRFPEGTRHMMEDRALRLVELHGDQRCDQFVVVEPDGIRFRPTT